MLRIDPILKLFRPPIVHSQATTCHCKESQTGCLEHPSDIF